MFKSVLASLGKLHFSGKIRVLIKLTTESETGGAPGQRPAGNNFDEQMNIEMVTQEGPPQYEGDSEVSQTS